MNSFEVNLARHFHNGKSHISIYPVIVEKSWVNGDPVSVPYKINLKSAFLEGKSWRSQQIFTGEDEGRPLKNWDDVIWLAQLELCRLSEIIEPLISDDIQSAWNAWAKINGKLDYLTLKLRHLEAQNETGKIKWFNILDDPDTDPRMKLNHWLPIWGAWKYFLEIFKNEYSSGKLKEI